MKVAKKMRLIWLNEWVCVSCCTMCLGDTEMRDEARVEREVEREREWSVAAASVKSVVECVHI